MEHNKSYCAECINFNDENRICTHANGKMKEMTLSKELAEAHHDCEEFEARRYRATAPALLWGVMKDNNINVSWKGAKKIYDEFIELMLESGYIEENNDEN